MASQRVGMPLIPCQMFTRTLQGMKYYTRAGEGVSSDWYCHSTAFPIYGTRQGSCDFPIVWVLISVVLINALRTLHEGMKFYSPDSSIISVRHIDGIVDDTTTNTNVKGCNETCLAEAQVLARSWEHLLFLSGGTLTWKKWFFYHINWA